MNVEVQSLRMELDELRRSVKDLQAGPRWPARLGLVAVGLMIGVVAARLPSNEVRAQQQDNKELVCSSLKVVGAGGKSVLTLGSDADGGVMQILGADGKLRVHLGVDDKQGPGHFELFDTKKQLMLSLGTDEDGGIMQIYGRDAKVRTIVAVAPKAGGGLINLFDTKKKIRLVLEGSDEGGVVEKR